MDWWTAAPAGSTCAVHPQALASATCPRCGSFACPACANPQVALCPACLERSNAGRAFPFDGVSWTIDGLLGFVWGVFRREWLLMSGAAIVFLLPLMVMSMVSGAAQLAFRGSAGAMTAVQLVVSAVNGLLLAVMTAGSIRFGAELLLGKKPDISVLFSQFANLRRLLPIALIMFVLFGLPGTLIGMFLQPRNPNPANPFEGFAEFGWILALVSLAYLPLYFFVGIPMQLAYGEAALTRASPGEVIRNAFTMVRGQRWASLGVLFLGGIAASAGILACCVGLIPGIGYFQALLAGLYLCVRHSNGLPRDR